MESYTKRANDMAERMELMASLMRRMAKGDRVAAAALSAHCRQQPYSGDVLCFDVDTIINDVISPPDSEDEG